MVEIRPMTSADLEAVDALMEFDPIPWTAADYLAITTFVAVDEGKVIGYAAGKIILPGAENELWHILVEPSRRGQGIASKLLKTLLAADEGIWFLEVRESNAAARTLYKSCGFSDFGRRKDYYYNPYEDAIVMRFRS